MRIGQGIDVHAFGPGEHVTLAGVRIAHTQGLVAHSDGDVVIHALCDALLGALALGAYFAFAAGTPTFWPIVLVACALPWLPLPGRPPAHPALLMSVSLVATTVVTHAIFFGEDRYHVVATPVLCLLAASALRRPAPRT